MHLRSCSNERVRRVQERVGDCFFNVFGWASSNLVEYTTATNGTWTLWVCQSKNKRAEE